ncbi:MltA domain-containing protein [Humitalea sp. 24SJ18S-53]|uniref:murein transglycosylase A n=1 Tax=Humitalea sp. 24SJ18S-53 TaxID=3422307 RepID=UPI003D66F014
MALVASALLGGIAAGDAAGQPMALPSSLPGWDTEAPAKSWHALTISCGAWAAMPPDRPLLTPAPPRAATAEPDPPETSIVARAANPAAWRGLCEAAADLARQFPLPEAPRRGNTPAAIAQREAVAEARQARDAAFRAMLDTYLVAVPLGTGILTGYYEPVLRGARQADLRHRTPLYARPPLAAEEPPPPPPVVEAPAPLLRRAAVAVAVAPPWAGVPRPTWPDPANLPRAGAVVGPAHEQAIAGVRTPVPADPIAKPDTPPPQVVEPLDASAEPAAPPELMSGHGLPPMRPGARPPSLPSRAAIESGALAGRGLELAYVDNAADAFFLHIQGSGRVLLADGKVLRLGYAAQNGHPYVPIGRILLNRGAIPRERMSMQAIRAWLSEAPPAEATALMAENPSFIFFRVMEGLRPDEGPPGSLGVPLIPGRSLAVDRAHVPMGAPVFLVGRDPLTGAPFHRLTMAQDTGGAIRGRARGDLFFGWGDAAGEAAGRTRDDAQFWVLIPRAVLEQPAPETTPAPETAAAQ